MSSTPVKKLVCIYSGSEYKGKGTKRLLSMGLPI